MIVFESVNKLYGDKPALVEVSFRIEPGEFVFITGPSGAGKSTIAKLLIREIVQTSGNIKVGEYDYGVVKAKDIPYLRRQIGIAFQDNKLFADRTVAENIALSLEILNKPRPTIEKTVQELLKVTSLTGKENYFPRQLSGGELQRVVIARALAMDPAILFADEPTGNLDTETGLQIVELLTRINEAGTTVMMSTHDTEMVKRMKKRTLVLQAGKLIKDTAVKTEVPLTKTESPSEPVETKP